MSWNELKKIVDGELKAKGLKDIKINYFDFSDVTIHPYPDVYIDEDGLTVQ